MSCYHELVHELFGQSSDASLNAWQTKDPCSIISLNKVCMWCNNPLNAWCPKTSSSPSYNNVGTMYPHNEVWHWRVSSNHLICLSFISKTIGNLPRPNPHVASLAQPKTTLLQLDKKYTHHKIIWHIWYKECFSQGQLSMLLPFCAKFVGFVVWCKNLNASTMKAFQWKRSVTNEMHQAKDANKTQRCEKCVWRSFWHWGFVLFNVATCVGRAWLHLLDMKSLGNAL